MAVSVVKVIPQTGSAQNSEGKETVNKSYLVEVSEEYANELEMSRIADYDIPAYGEAHTWDSRLTVTGKSAKRANGSDGKPSKFHWIIDVTWSIPSLTSSSAPTGNGPTGESANSSQIRVSVSGVESTYSTQMSRAADPDPIRNVFGDLYPDPIEVTDYDEQITIDYESSGFDTGDTELRGKINDDEVSLSISQGNITFSRTYLKHTLLLKGIDYDIEPSKSGAGDTYRVRVVCLYRPSTWDKSLPEKGYRWWTGVGEDLTFTDWQDHAEYLDENAQKLGEGDAIISTDPIQVYYEGDLSTFLEAI